MPRSEERNVLSDELAQKQDISLSRASETPLVSRVYSSGPLRAVRNNATCSRTFERHLLGTALQRMDF